MNRDTPVRAILVGFAALIALLAGAWVVAAAAGGGPSAFLAILLLRAPDASLLCALAGWGAVAAGVLAVMMFHGAYSQEESPQDRRRFPKGAPVALFLAALGLVWLAFACAGREGRLQEPAAAPVAAGALPASVPESEPEAQAAPAPAHPPLVVPRPEVSARALPLRWIYAEPMILDGEWRASPAARKALAALFPVDDPDGSVRALLCGKAWVALAGGASQEGPLERNERRARLRAELAAEAAALWLAAQGGDCRRPLLFGLDLGQHIATLVDPAPEATAGQRQLLVVSRDAAGADERVSANEAESEIQAFYADPAGRAVLLGARRYSRDPLVFLAADPR